MTGPQRRFDPAELRIPGEPDPTLAEQADALATARDLEALALDSGVRPTDGFEDRVMAAIAAEPAPRLVVAPAGTVRGGVVGAFLLTVRQSWAVATARRAADGGPRAGPRVRPAGRARRGCADRRHGADRRGAHRPEWIDDRTGPESLPDGTGRTRRQPERPRAERQPRAERVAEPS